MDDIPTFDEFVEKAQVPKGSQWLKNHPEVLQMAIKLLDEGRPAQTVSRYLAEYYGWPFKDEALTNNIRLLRDHS